MAPPAAALFAASGPTIPSGEPFPNLSLSLDHLLASLYPIIAATVDPSAGSIPIKVPIPDDLRIVYFNFFNSNNDGSLKALACILSTTAFSFSDCLNNSLTANKLTHTVTIRTTTVTKVLARAVSAATNVKGDGDTIIRQMGKDYKALTNTLMSTLRGNFNSLKAKSPSTIKFVRGSRSGNIIKVIILEAEGVGGKQRGNFELAQKQYRDALQDFYSGFLDLLGVTLERKSSSNKTGKVSQEKAGQVFNLEHFKATSNIKSFINDSIHTALLSHYSEDEYDNLEQDLRRLGLKTHLEIKRTPKLEKFRYFLEAKS